MKYPFHRNSIVWAGIILVAMLTPQLQATEPAIEQRLQQYFQLLNSTSGPTDPGIFSAASGYWLKGIHGQHISVSRFFLLHEPGEWQVEEVQQAGDYAAVTISFDSANYSQPWLVQFELLRAGLLMTMIRLRPNW
jgi:hypothetical protein